MIANFLKNSTKFRGKGIDIRADGGYVVGPPSVLNGKSYEVINPSPIIDIPTSLIHRLIVDRQVPATASKATQNANKPQVNEDKNANPKNSEYHFNLTDEK